MEFLDTILASRFATLLQNEGNKPEQVVQYKGIHRTLPEMVVLHQAETAAQHQVGKVDPFPVEMVVRYLSQAVVALASAPENTKNILYFKLEVHDPICSRFQVG